MTAQPLAGLRVLVTRPVHQAAPLCEMIVAAGGIPLALPALDIAPPDDTTALRGLARDIERYDLAIFVSPNAVRGAVELLGRLPPVPLVAAIGPATARALADAGRPDALCPDSEFNSEALLRVPALGDVSGRHIVIFRGDGGRGLLGDTLRTRGATVEYAQVYRRALPSPPRPEVAEALRRRQVGAVTATSEQALEQLVALCGDDLRHGLLGAQLVVASGRMVKLAESLGFCAPLVAAAPSDRALVQALIAWRAGRSPGDRQD